MAPISIPWKKHTWALLCLDVLLQNYSWEICRTYIAGHPPAGCQGAARLSGLWRPGWYSDKVRSKVKLGKKTHRSASSALRALVDDSNRKYSSRVLHLFTSEVNVLLGIPIMKIFCSVDVCARLSLIIKTWRHQAEASALIQHFPRAVDSKAKQALMQFQHCFAHRKNYPQPLIQKSWTGFF